MIIICTLNKVYGKNYCASRDVEEVEKKKKGMIKIKSRKIQALEYIQHSMYIVLLGII